MQKIKVLFFGIIFALLFLEIGLSVGSYIFQRYMVKQDKHVPLVSKKQYTTLNILFFTAD